jgi:acyl-CoA thioester hydrolase
MKTKVYYADTDAGGVVYYANYLRWLEMGRTEWLEGAGLSVAEYARQGVIFAVVRVEIDYHSPAVLGDEVEIETWVERLRRVRFTMGQRVRRSVDGANGAELATAQVTLACISPTGKALALPEELAEALSQTCLSPASG